MHLVKHITAEEEHNLKRAITSEINKWRLSNGCPPSLHFTPYESSLVYTPLEELHWIPRAKLNDL